MRSLLTIDLPRRLSARLPGPVTEVLVGVVLAAAFVLVRAMLTPWLREGAIFPLSMLAIVLAVLLAGWRSGLVALLFGQAGNWYFVLPPVGSFDLVRPGLGYSLLLATISQGLMLFALALYQRQVRAGEMERARRINFLGHALREMDHRTKNNFQIVTSMLILQANRSASADVQAALREAAERLKAVSAVYDALAPSSQGLQTVRLQDQLQEICDQIKRGILPDRIALETELEPMLVPHETAVAIGIVVNELVTNACKHAFAETGGRIAVRARREGGEALIEVADDGRGYTPGTSPRNGMGTRLVAAFVQRVRGTSEVQSSPAGTIHRIRVPVGARP